MPRVSLTAAVAEVARHDRVMRRLIERTGPCALRRGRGEPFAALVESIVYQQLAGRAAQAIHGRFVAALDGRPTPEAILATRDGALRAVGLSKAKAESIRDLAAKVRDGTVPLEGIDHLPDDEIVARLSAVRGIGRWTAEMFLIFQLRRLDVWPVGDYGVRKGYALAYRLPALPTPKELTALGARFSPYRTVAAWYCWRAVETITPGAGRVRVTRPPTPRGYARGTPRARGSPGSRRAAASRAFRSQRRGQAETHPSA